MSRQAEFRFLLYVAGHSQNSVRATANLNALCQNYLADRHQIEVVDVFKVGRALRFHKAFGPAGTNVNFVQRLDGRTLKVRTYERGVEGETLACGTGVTASAIAGTLKGWGQAPVRCRTAGGDVLHVDFQLHPGDPKTPATCVSLRGPVRITFKGETFV